MVLIPMACMSKISQTVTEIVPARDSDGSLVGCYKRDDKKQMDSECTLEIESSGLVNRLEVKPDEQRKELRAMPSFGA